MIQALKLFPIYLVIITVLFVILPTIITAVMRISLYKYLVDLDKKTRRLVNNESEGIQPKFINKLQQRFNKASQNIENVNTVALIDGIYHQETFAAFGFKIRCEEGEYITKSLPNLLLAFGLLGTFLGITLNLNSISQIINQDSTNIIDLTNKLQTPLQSMGIAFITSLIGLFCSSVLIVINLKYNINLEKNSLLNNLEDYLDNIYKPLVQGETRLDKAVNRMVDQQHEFLKRFHENVGQVLERTFKQATDRIAEENEKAQKLAYEVYQRLLDASSTINTGANIFQESTHLLENQVNNIKILLPLFEASSTNFMDAALKIEQSKFSENLDKTTQNLANIQANFAKTTKLLSDNIPLLIDQNKQAINLAQEVYYSLQNTANKIEDSVLIFSESAEIIKNSQFADNLVIATSTLVNTQEQFYEIAVMLNQGSKPIEVGINTLQDSVGKMVKLSEEFHHINENYLVMNDLGKQMLIQQETTLNETITTLQTHEQKLNLTMINLSEKMVKEMNNSVSSNNQQINSLITSFEQQISLLNDLSKQLLIQQGKGWEQTQLKLSETITSLQTHQKNVNSTIMSFAEKMVKEINNEVGSNNQKINSLITSFEQQISLLNDLSKQLLIQQGEGWKQTQLKLNETITSLQTHEQNLNSTILSFAEKIVKNIENNTYQSLIGELGGEGLTRYYELKGLTQTLIKEVKQNAKDINYLSKIEGQKILTETAFKYLPKIQEKLGELAEPLRQYHDHHLDSKGRKCSLKEAEQIGQELRYLGMELMNIHTISDLRIMYRVAYLFTYQLGRFKHYKDNKYSLETFMRYNVLNALNECMSKTYSLN
jgi:hypothetical protein